MLGDLVSSVIDTLSLGADSWVEALLWWTGIGAAVCAAASLRHQVLQSRATLFLELYDDWETLSKNRMAFVAFYSSVLKPTLKKLKVENIDALDKQQTQIVREAFKRALSPARGRKLPDIRKLSAYLNFFETLGTYARKRYVPERELLTLYEGAILEIDLAFREIIAVWQSRPSSPDGLFRNAIYLMKRTRFKRDHPKLCWWIAPIDRYLSRLT
jgi:hypothetical protein